jgi:hypothetical protein
MQIVFPTTATFSTANAIGLRLFRLVMIASTTAHFASSSVDGSDVFDRLAAPTRAQTIMNHVKALTVRAIQNVTFFMSILS